MNRMVSSNSGFFTWIQDQVAKQASAQKHRAAKAAGVTIGNWSEYLNRQKMSVLLEANEERLLDIGVNREDLREALNLPLDTNAANWLKHRSRKRRSFEGS